MALLVVVTLVHLAENGAGIDTLELWGDEASTYLIATMPFPEFIIYPTRVHSQPALYYVLLHFWSWLGTSEAWIRFPSWLSMLGLMWFVVLEVKELGLLGRAAFCLCLIPNWLTTYLSQELRPYALGVFLSFVSSVFFYRLINAPERRPAVLYAVSALAMLYTLAFNVWTFAAHALFGFLVVARHMFTEPRKTLATYRWVIAAGVSVALAYLPYVLYASSVQDRKNIDTWAALSQMFVLGHYESAFKAVFRGSFALGYLGIGLSLIAVVFGIRRRSMAWLWIVVVIGQVAFVHVFLHQRSFYANRYLTPAWAPACFLAAMGFEALLTAARSRIVTIAAWLIIVTSLAGVGVRSAPKLVASVVNPKPKGTWRSLHDDLAKFPGKKIVMFDVGWKSEGFRYVERDEHDVTFFINAGPGVRESQGRNLTDPYVRDVLTNHATLDSCVFYVQESGARGLHATVVKPMLVERGFREVLHKQLVRSTSSWDPKEVFGYCGPTSPR